MNEIEAGTTWWRPERAVAGGGAARAGSRVAFGALVGLALTVAASAVSASNGLEILTFSGPVALPGVTLNTGTYIFEAANPDSGGSVIRVRDRRTGRPMFLGFTNPVQRPAGLRADRSIVLGEAVKGAATPIVAWYPVGKSMGREFVYR